MHRENSLHTENEVFETVLRSGGTSPSSSLTAALDVHHGEEKPQGGMYEGSSDYLQEKGGKIDEGQKLKFNTDPNFDNSNMCDNSDVETIIVTLGMNHPNRIEPFPKVDI